MTELLSNRPHAATGQIRDRVGAAEAANRAKPICATGTAPTSKRRLPSPDRATGTTMSYQLGFASGPGA